jgi:hypothetical protein
MERLVRNPVPYQPVTRMQIVKGPEIADHAFALLLDPSRDFKKYLDVRQRIKGRHPDA